MKSDPSKPVDVTFMRWPENPDLPLPDYATAGAAAFDLRAAIPPQSLEVIEPGARVLVGIGFAVAVPSGYEMQIRPRSGLALRHGVTVMNSPATIDSDFRGQVCVCLVNLGSEPFTIRRGDRIAQALVSPVVRVRLTEVDTLAETERGHSGFGSTGTQ